MQSPLSYVIFRILPAAAGLTCLGLASSCSRETSPPKEAAAPAAVPQVENFLEVAPGIYSGGDPHGPETFAALKKLGITTIVSVDGAKPDVAAAEAAGLKYIHLPTGYDGIGPATAKALAGITQTQQGPLYIHCHHGKHRGPASACIVAMGNGSMSVEQSETFMEKAGTGKNYTGLWRDVRSFPSLPADTRPAPLVASADTDPLVDSMSGLDLAFEQLQDALKATDKPDAKEAASKVILILEGYQESLRHLPSDAAPELRGLMETAVKGAEALRGKTAAGDLEYLRQQVPVIKSECSACHKKYRDS